jgi:peptidoglycan DL-endopeptidase LytE
MKKNATVKKLVLGSAFAVAMLASRAVADAALEDQVLSRGMSNSYVEQLQDILKNKGYYSSSVDGIYGPITHEAVRKFQREAGIQVDGIAGPQTFSKLNSGNSSASSSSNNSSSSNTVLRQGSRGQSVSSLQRQLTDLGYNTNGVDGIYGSNTARAVRDFQRSNNLSVDGIAGSQTFGALNDSPRSNGSSGSTKSSSSNNSSSSDSKKTSQTSSSSSSSSASAMISTAKNQIGTPYKWGGTTTSGFDCSGFLNYVFAQHGQSLPRTVSAIWDAGTSVSNPSPGDIVFFETYTSGPSHAGMYLGNNQYIHAGS